jgi:carbon monoxide dehydrogenase subunit G
VLLEQQFEIPGTADRVWRWFNNIEAVVDCLPGASLRAPPDSGKLQLAMVVKLGPISTNFIGEGEIDLDDATRKGIVSGAAVDRKSGSRIKGRVCFAVSESLGSPAHITRVALAIEYTMGGTLAQFSRESIVRDLAQRLTDTFAANMCRKLESTSALVTAATASPSADVIANCTAPQEAGAALPRNRSPFPKASLNLGAVLWAAFMDHIRQLFRRRPTG